MIIDPYTLHLPEIYSETVNTVKDQVNQIQCNVGTVMGAGPEIAENDIKNLPYVFAQNGVNDLKGIFSGKPAIIVSTGPQPWEEYPSP